VEIFNRLEENEFSAYAHMIPGWLIGEAKTDDSMEVWGMEIGGEPCGAAVISREPGIVVLMHLYVAEKYRNSGRGGDFLFDLMYDAYTQGVAQFRVEYITEQFPKMDRLLRSYPMKKETMEQMGNVECTLGELAEIKALQGSYGQVKALSQCTEEGLSRLYREVIARELDVVELPLRKDDYLADCSAVAMENGEPKGLLLVKKAEDGVFIPYIVNLSQNAAAPIEMIRFSIQKGSESFSKETVCHFAIINEALLALFEKMGIRVRKMQRFTLDLSYFEKCERNVNAYMDFLSIIAV